MMKKITTRALVLCFLMIFMAGAALAAGSGVRTSLTFRVTTPTQNSVVSVGQDLQIEVGVDGVEPTSWQWFFEGTPITENGDQRVYNIVNAQMSDAGIYRMQAYVGERMVLSVDVNVRVIDTSSIPQAGDDSMPVYYAFAAMGCGVVGLIALAARKRMAA